MLFKKILRGIQKSIFENIRLMGQLGAYTGLLTGFLSMIFTYEFKSKLPLDQFLYQVLDFVLRLASFSLILSIGLIISSVIVFTVVGIIKGITRTSSGS